MDNNGDRDKEGEWNCEGGADIGGVEAATEAGFGVAGVEPNSKASAIFPFQDFA